MKLSLAWIFDHINAAWHEQDINHIVERFNAITAEIEHIETIKFDLSSCALCLFSSAASNGWAVSVPEWNMTVTLPARPEVFSDKGQHYFMVKKVGDALVWATLADFGVDKGGLIPEIEADQTLAAGCWREVFEHSDVIIEVDNKSITHRPDMWGHRGFAREIAAFLNLGFKQEHEMLASLRVQEFATASTITQSTPIIIENQDEQACKCFSGLYFSSLVAKPCNLLILSRLLKIGARPINGLVDLTNYVMNDWGNPVHAYDAQRITDKKVVIRKALPGEKLDLLDGNGIELTVDDLVVADGKKPMCLAGIKGGVNDSLSSSTTAVFFEAATFDAATVRHAAIRHKIRTDASARFEKTLDPMQTVQTTQRFVQLLRQYDFAMTCADEIIVVGSLPQETIIEIDHDFIEQRMGVTLPPHQVIDMLSRLEFKVLKTSDAHKKALYMVSVPTFRASKDIKIKEDILEEIVRCYGFEHIPLSLPKVARTPFSLEPIMRLRKLKNYLSYAAGMTEQQGYAFLDEAFTKQLGVQLEATSQLVNPVSENMCQLIPSLIPNLLKNVSDNLAQAESLAFYEVGRVWIRATADDVSEQQRLAGIFFEKRKPVNFYECKHRVTELFSVLGFPAASLTWQKYAGKNVWYHPFQSAQLVIDGQIVGSMGMLDATLLRTLDVLDESSACLFDIDAEFLLTAKRATARYQQLSKFQETFFDLSLLVPLTVTAQTLQQTLASIDPLVRRVELIDFFEKKEWHDVRSLTLRCWVCHDEKTLEKHEIDALWQKAITTLEQHGTRIRS
ncbi:MAG: phenylalanine--tRNA ligase subunit beta [Candidatus Babeliales bacterium]